MTLPIPVTSVPGPTGGQALSGQQMLRNYSRKAKDARSQCGYLAIERYFPSEIISNLILVMDLLGTCELRRWFLRKMLRSIISVGQISIPRQFSSDSLIRTRGATFKPLPPTKQLRNNPTAETSSALNSSPKKVFPMSPTSCPFQILKSRSHLSIPG